MYMHVRGSRGRRARTPHQGLPNHQWVTGSAYPCFLHASCDLGLVTHGDDHEEREPERQDERRDEVLQEDTLRQLLAVARELRHDHHVVGRRGGGDHLGRG